MSGASAIGVPGCPEFACWTASIDSVRMQLIDSWSSWAPVIGLGESSAGLATALIFASCLVPADLSSCCGFLHMAAELVAHGGKELVGEGRLAAGAETFVKRGGKHWRRHRRVDGRFDCPASFTGVGDAPREAIERRILGQRGGGKVEQPRGDDTAASPNLCDVAQVEIVPIELRIA